MKIQFQNHLIVLIVALIGFYVLSADITFQSGIAQGDHGRDFYATNQTSKGDMPFRDYWWAYGPLMPYYYACFFDVLGEVPQSIIIARNLLIIFGGVFFYKILSIFCSPALALTGTLWFFLFNPQFTHTFNHVGVVSLSLALVYCILKYISTLTTRYINVSFLLVALISLIKLNMGIAYFMAMITSILLINEYNQIRLSKDEVRKTCRYLAVYTLVILFAYGIHLIGLPKDFVKQCLYLSPKFNTAYNLTFFEIFENYLINLKNMLLSREAYDRFYVGLFISSIYITLRLRMRKIKTESQKRLSLALDVLFVFIGFSMHEYVISGVIYKLIWSRPFEFLLIFICVDRILKNIHRFVYWCFIIVMIYVCCINHIGRNNWKNYIKNTTNNQYFEFDQGRYYSQNSIEWFNTVKNTVKYLDQHLEDDERFLALPYDPIYYFLLDRKSPISLIFISESLGVSENQQKEIINQLNSQSIRFIVISSQINSNAPGLGHFGNTYCHHLDKYINENFQVMVQYGEWEQAPDYMSNHGTRILRRKEQ